MYRFGYFVICNALAILFLLAPVTARAANYWYSHADLQRWNRRADVVETGGSYAVWICAPEGTAGAVTINGQSFYSEGSDSDTHLLGWRQVGTIAFRAGAAIRVTLPKKDSPVAQVALSVHAGFDPRETWALSRVMGASPDPVPDSRLTPTRHTDTHYTMPAYHTRAEWEARKSYLRQRILVAAGLWPEPEKTPLNAQVFDRVEHDDYITEKVLFESYPGYFVTANLYRPKGKTGPFPGILNPHGHWSNNRLEHSDIGSVPARCINFAKRGFIAVAWDMAGRGESWQMPHHFQTDRTDMWGVNNLGIHLWSSIRALDFLLSLPDVDPTRIGITGASGGGTQTFILTAVDDRIHVTAPVNMISSTMQGGCFCENVPLLRIDANNMEIGALAAPRPLLMVSASGDWTAQTLEVEYPSIRSIYALYNATDRIRGVRQNSPHNYNQQSREWVYAWFTHWLQKPHGRISEPELPFEASALTHLSVFADRPHPASAVAFEDFIEQRIAVNAAQMQSYRPHDYWSLRRLRDVYGPALQQSLSTEIVRGPDVNVVMHRVTARPGYTVRHLTIGRKRAGDAIPATLWIPTNRGSAATATLIAHSDGKQALLNVAENGPGSLIAGLLERGQLVLTFDPFLIGEFHGLQDRSERTGAVRGSRAQHFYTFNKSDAACRVQDVLTCLAYLERRDDVAQIHLVGLGDAGLWTLLARSQSTRVSRTVIDLNNFSAADDQAWMTTCYIPGIRRAGDIRTAAALAAPGDLLLMNTGADFDPDWAQAGYAAAQATPNLRIAQESVSESDLIQFLSGSSAP